MAKTIHELIASHQSAAREFADAVRRETSSWIEDDAFDAESNAMLALLSYPPKTIEEARMRSAYLTMTRFPDALDAEGRAFLHSFL